jgi:hypothetical protein
VRRPRSPNDEPQLSLVVANGHTERETGLSLSGSTVPQTVLESDTHPLYVPLRLAMAPPVARQRTRRRTSAAASAPPEAEERPAASSAAVLLSQVAPVIAAILGVAHCPLS